LPSHTFSTGWLERLLGFQNHALPQMLAWGVIPYYHAAAATQALRSRLWPYMSEAPLTIKLLTNHITKWQVSEGGSSCRRFMQWGWGQVHKIEEKWGYNDAGGIGECSCL
jgi:hypothetical protein